MTWIYNGFDPSDFRRVATPSTSTRCRLVYTGTLWNLMSLRPLVDAVRRLRESEPHVADALEVVVAGRAIGHEAAVVTELGRWCRVVSHDYLQHADAVSLMQSADALCIVLSDVPGMERWVPAKTFEYMAARRPILALIPDGELQSLLAGHPCADVCAPGDVAGIAATLSRMVASWQRGERRGVGAWTPDGFDSAEPGAGVGHGSRRCVREKAGGRGGGRFDWSGRAGMSVHTLRVAIVGCGQIADAHLQEVSKIATARVVAVCDRHEDLAYQAGARFGVGSHFTDLDLMLASEQPDVVHITTPPHTHLPIALRCLEAGAHVYIEKPFTLDLDEANRLLNAAEDAGRLACAGHDHVFLPVWQSCLALARDGALGDVVHLDCIRGYDLTGLYGALVSSDPNHWIHKLPGGIFQNVISHAVCLATPFLGSAIPDVLAASFGASGRVAMPTELRSMLIGDRASAAVHVFSQARPVRRIARVCGTRATVEVDFDSGLMRSVVSARLPGALGRVEVPLRHLVEASRNAAFNLRRFSLGEIQGTSQECSSCSGSSTTRSATVRRLPYRTLDVRHVTAIMDKIFRQCGGARGAAYREQGAA